MSETLLKQLLCAQSGGHIWVEHRMSLDSHSRDDHYRCVECGYTRLQLGAADPTLLRTHRRTECTCEV
jgi:hypothetical protein